jgi:hypothetical protein
VIGSAVYLNRVVALEAVISEVQQLCDDNMVLLSVEDPWLKFEWISRGQRVGLEISVFRLGPQDVCHAATTALGRMLVQHPVH